MNATPPLAAPLALHVNGRAVSVQVPADAPLLAVLRNDLALNGPKYGCGLGECGACMVLIDGQAARACVLPASAAVGRAVTTLEGLGSVAAPHPVQRAFIEAQAAQCGYCLNGMIVATVALLAHTPRPSDAQVRAALSHNLCRCGTHLEILQAVQRAAVLVAAARADGAPEPGDDGIHSPDSPGDAGGRAPRGHAAGGFAATPDSHVAAAPSSAPAGARPA